MPRQRVKFRTATNELRKGKKVVGRTDEVYDLTGKKFITFREVLVEGDLNGDLTYNAHIIQITKVDTMTGLKVDLRGARGPVWEGVECKVIR
jgi:hypothetical protein